MRSRVVTNLENRDKATQDRNLKRKSRQSAFAPGRFAYANYPFAFFLSIWHACEEKGASIRPRLEYEPRVYLRLAGVTRRSLAARPLPVAGLAFGRGRRCAHRTAGA